jgi:hypothetical protein
VPLEGGGLDVDPAGQHHVAVEAADLVGGEVEVELGVVDPLTLGREELDQLGTTVLLGGAEHLDEVRAEAVSGCLLRHVHSFEVIGEGGVSACRGLVLRATGAGVVRL